VSNGEVGSKSFIASKDRLSMHMDRTDEAIGTAGAAVPLLLTG
jgi:hypothetical protein